MLGAAGGCGEASRTRVRGAWGEFKEFTELLTRRGIPQRDKTLTTKFSNAAKSYGLQISITKTEVMYQPAPGKPYVEPSITIDTVQLPVTKQFKYLSSVLSNDAQMDEDIKARISKASSAYGRLQERVWKPHCIKLNTKIKTYRATVLTPL